MKTKKPILIKDSIIGSANLSNKIQSDKIFELSIFKESKQGITYLFTEKEKNPRIITTITNNEFRVKSEKELNIIFGLNAENDICISEYLIKNKKAIYNLKVDKTFNKFGNGDVLKKFELSKLPEYIIKNKKKFLEWMD